MPDSESRGDPRVDRVCTHVTYEIATGVFQPESRLPTIREAVERWQVDHRIVLKAYRRLEQLGLIRRVPRSGFFVLAGESLDIISRHRFELETMFDRLATEISETTGLSVLGAMRYLSQLAAIRSREKPECIFVECTQIQAQGHAAEVTQRLAIPCLPLTLDQIQVTGKRIPPSIRTVLVTGFHFAELQTLRKSKRFRVLSVPIEVSPELTRWVSGQNKTIVFESDETQAQHMVEDVQRLLEFKACRLEITSDINASLQTTLGNSRRKKQHALLSPRLWGQVHNRWREHPNVGLIRYRIVQSAWPAIAETIGLPLGAMPAADL